MPRKYSKRHPLHLYAAIVALVIFLFIGLLYFRKSDQVTAQTSPTPVGQSGNWELVFSDDFDGTSLDTTKWIACFPWGTTAGCQSTTTPKSTYQINNVIVENGMVRLRTQKGSFTGSDGKTYPYSSGMISTASYWPNDTPMKFTSQYGYFEARIRVPKGKGLWPAFWLLPQSQAWPPEIDIMENLTGTDIDTHSHHMHFHYLDEAGVHRDSGAQWDSPADLSSDFHVYAVSWQPDAIRWYVDGIERRAAFTDTRYIPAERMYMILNLQVGGSWPGDPDTTTPFPSYYDIDYVRVWHPSTPSAAPTATVTPTPTSRPSATPTPTTRPTATPTPTNQITNGSFEKTGTTWLSPWTWGVKTGASASISQDTATAADGSRSARASILRSNQNYWYVQLSNAPIQVTAGRTYTLVFWAKASKNRTIIPTLQQNYSPDTEYFKTTTSLTTSWRKYTYTFTPTQTDSNVILRFNLASATGTVWIDGVSFK